VPAIQGWLSDPEGLFYRQLVKRIKNGVVVEVGSWKGRSTGYIGRICKKNNNRLICVDWWDKGSTDSFDHAYREMAAGEDIQAVFLENMSAAGIPVQPWKLSSLEAAKRIKKESLHMVFLDASHDFTAVRDDIECWFARVKKGGILVGHDYQTKHPGLIRAVDSFVKKANLLLKKGPGSMWYIRK
ncbi:MAG: class I SAM-dependent methyltransferase, partial [bacterium]|nr:class I SAM-dependent methyltransferase [bacterium]